MGSVDCLKDIANSLDLFFKGLSDCGLLQTYEVQFLEREILDTSSKMKFRIVVNEFLINMQKTVENITEADELLFQKEVSDILQGMVVEDEASTMVEEESIHVLPQYVVSNTITCDKIFNNNDLANITENLSTEENIEDGKPIEDVLNIVYSNKGKNGITEPWQLSILEVQPVDTTIDTITEVMTKDHLKDEGWQCTMCNKIFQRMQNLQEHCREEHNGTGCFECNICGTRVMSKISLKRHIHSHSGISSLTCSICNKTFKRSDYLATHYKLHEGIRSYECLTCGKKFISKTHLNLHKKVHSDRKDYVCNQCNKSFVRRDKLRDHMLRHLNIKRFQCSVCNKKYAEKRDLRTHLKVHY